jgi:hypothetical protein
VPLVPEGRPHPGLLLLMAQRSVGPGEAYEFSILGSGRTQTYRRLT